MTHSASACIILSPPRPEVATDKNMQMKAPIFVLFPDTAKIEIFVRFLNNGENTIIELLPAFTQARETFGSSLSTMTGEGKKAEGKGQLGVSIEQASNPASCITSATSRAIPTFTSSFREYGFLFIFVHSNQVRCVGFSAWL